MSRSGFPVFLVCFLGGAIAFGFPEKAPPVLTESQLNEIRILLKEVKTAENACVSGEVVSRLREQKLRLEDYASQLQYAISAYQEMQFNVETDKNNVEDIAYHNFAISTAWADMEKRKKAYLWLVPTTFGKSLDFEPTFTKFAERNEPNPAFAKGIRRIAEEKIVPVLKKVFILKSDRDEEGRRTALAYLAVAEKFVVQDPLETETAQFHKLNSFAALAKKQEKWREDPHRIGRDSDLALILRNIFANRHHVGDLAELGIQWNIQFLAMDAAKLGELDNLRIDLNQSQEIQGIRNRMKRVRKAYREFLDAKKIYDDAVKEKEEYLIAQGLPRTSLKLLEDELKMINSLRPGIELIVESAKRCQRELNEVKSGVNFGLRSPKLLRNSLRRYERIRTWQKSNHRDLDWPEQILDRTQETLEEYRK